MTSPSTGDKIQFGQWLKNHNEYLKNMREHIQFRVDSVKERNDMLSVEIQESYPQSNMTFDPLSPTFHVTQQLAQTTMQACDEHITTKLDQINKGNQTIESRMKEEAMRSKDALYKILNLDEISLKPYDEVVTATEELTQETKMILSECEDTKQKASNVIENLKKDYTELTKDITTLEILTKELSLEITNLRNNLNDKLFTLNLTTSKSLNVESSEIVELSKEIADLEAKLANYSKYV